MYEDGDPPESNTTIGFLGPAVTTTIGAGASSTICAGATSIIGGSVTTCDPDPYDFETKTVMCGHSVEDLIKMDDETFATAQKEINVEIQRGLDGGLTLINSLTMTTTMQIVCLRRRNIQLEQRLARLETLLQ